MKRIILNRKYISKLATRWTTGIFAVLGLIGTFTSLSDLINESISLKYRIAISAGILIGVWIVSFIVCAVYIHKKRRIEILEINGGNHVYVQYGDVFSEDEVLNPEERRNVVIPVNRCFDTLVDDDLVSSRTLHGIAMRKLYSEGYFDENSLNSAIQQNLNNRQIMAEGIQASEKRSGNLKRYPTGTVAEVQVSSNCTYFFLGLSSFDKNLKATTSNEEYVLALMKLLEFCNDRSQQFPVVMPLIGGGLSRTQKKERSILEYLVKLIKMNEDLIHGDIHIVVRESGKESIAITDL